MHRTLNRLLFVTAAALVALDAGWVLAGHFAIDARAYGLAGPMILLLAGAALYYDRWRHEVRLSATLGVTAFLMAFPAAASLLSYLLLTIAGSRIDGLLAAADLALGFRWTAVMTLAAAHPFLNAVLGFAYLSVMPQTLALIFLLGLRGRLEALYGLALALAAGALITLGIWTLFPSFGAFSVFTLPDAVAARLGLVLGADYGRILTHMLQHGPGFIVPTDIRGLVGFPSYHTLQAIVLFWYVRQEPYLRWASLALNLVVLVAIPVQGGHHLMDMLGGALVAVASIGLAHATVIWAKGAPIGAKTAPAALPAMR